MIDIRTLLALPLYLFARYHIHNEPVPDFTHNQNWYDNYLLLGGKPKKKRTLPQEQSVENTDEQDEDDEAEDADDADKDEIVGPAAEPNEQGKHPIS